MRWEKLGRIVDANAANPVPLRLDGDRYRIYFSERDAENRSSITWIEIDLRDPRTILAAAPEPILTPGPLGAFDDSGASLACIVRDGDMLFLYYLGWNLGVTVPWRNSIGLASSRDGLHFTRVSPAPIVDRNRRDPFSLSYPFVMRDASGWRMWYGSNLRWGAEQRDMDHVIKYATGTSAEDWQPTGTVCIGIEHAGEYAFARPCVMRDGALWRMWYSYRGDAYRIGYAESDDGVVWRRRDAEAGIEPSSEGWDSESIEYPYVFDHDGARYMLYNGNRYGLTGFGLAKLPA